MLARAGTIDGAGPGRARRRRPHVRRRSRPVRLHLVLRPADLRVNPAAAGCRHPGDAETRLGDCVAVAFVASVLVAVAVIADAALCARGSGRRRRRDAAPTRISLYGDSLAHQARPDSFAALDRPRPRCDRDRVDDVPGSRALRLPRRRSWPTSLRRPARGARPRVLRQLVHRVHARRTRARFRAIGSAAGATATSTTSASVLTVAARTDTTVVWATAPPVRHPAEPGRLPAAARPPRTPDGRVRTLALRVVDTGAALTTDGRSFARDAAVPPTTSTRSASTARSGSAADDGLHFDCHGHTDAHRRRASGTRPARRRFGEAIADAAVAALER